MKPLLAGGEPGTSKSEGSLTLKKQVLRMTQWEKAPWPAGLALRSALPSLPLPPRAKAEVSERGEETTAGEQLGFPARAPRPACSSARGRQGALRSSRSGARLQEGQSDSWSPEAGQPL
jgi:hypothetical protein